MPTGTPTPAQLWNGDVSFFSIDTDLIQSAKYDFDKGALNLLPKQLPRTMQLQLTDIVAKEIVNHLLDPVLEDARKFSRAASELTRRAQIDMSSIEQTFNNIGVEETARALFRQRVEAYAHRCHGGILPVQGDELAAEVFDHYFSRKPPFGERKDKKAEFPDAMSLILLERFARAKGTLGIVASNDEGWTLFAADSPSLYCVRSIDELAKLFADTGEHGERISACILAAVEDDNSALRDTVAGALAGHFDNAEWTIDDIYSSGSTRVEAEAIGANLSEYSIASEQIEVWSLEEEPSTWVVEIEVTATAEVEIQVTHYVWDSIDREEFRLRTDTVTVEHEIEAKVFLTCADVHDDTPPEEWDIEVEIAKGRYAVSVGEVDPFFD
jgi:hypothetical protein